MRWIHLCHNCFNLSLSCLWSFFDYERLEFLLIGCLVIEFHGREGTETQVDWLHLLDLLCCGSWLRDLRLNSKCSARPLLCRLLFFFVVSLLIFRLATERQTVIGVLGCLLDKCFLRATPILILILVKARVHHRRCSFEFFLSLRDFAVIVWTLRLLSSSSWFAANFSGHFVIHYKRGIPSKLVFNLLLWFFFKVESVLMRRYSFQITLQSFANLLLIDRSNIRRVRILHKAVCNSLSASSRGYSHWCAISFSIMCDYE